jgi:hypothetical protein
VDDLHGPLLGTHAARPALHRLRDAFTYRCGEQHSLARRNRDVPAISRLTARAECAREHQSACEFRRRRRQRQERPTPSQSETTPRLHTNPAATRRAPCAIVWPHLVPRIANTKQRACEVKRETGKRLDRKSESTHAETGAQPVLSPQRSHGERSEIRAVRSKPLPACAGGKANAMSRQPGYRPGARGRRHRRRSLEPRETDASARDVSRHSAVAHRMQHRMTHHSSGPAHAAAPHSP